MKILKALIVSLLLFFVDASYRRDAKDARLSAYAKTGKAIQKAKKSGKRVNGSQLYRKHYSNAIRCAAEKRERRKNFINAAI